jgi:hypothetical protein
MGKAQLIMPNPIQPVVAKEMTEYFSYRYFLCTMQAELLQHKTQANYLVCLVLPSNWMSRMTQSRDKEDRTPLRPFRRPDSILEYFKLLPELYISRL